ncbi:MAG: RdgB/HAM1 family non-canonical purine NTP pyrophosphatase [Rhodobacteraceae bacterium]|nr:RdgB/HAM1 family non-canonical purine NTP pyrophosphatase [Paracoccaceae bacterium]
MRKFTAEKLVVASHNQGKLEEIARLMQPFGISTVSAGELGFDEPEETEDNFIGNARIKAHYAAEKSGLPALADDSGIEIDALNGAPGVYTADWAETPNGRDFTMAMTKTWKKLEEVNAAHPRTARFCCTLVLAWPDGHFEVFEGKIDGKIVWPMQGEQGHGYDPIFQPNGFDITFGKMDRWKKNEISHRADAFKKLVKGCFN